MLSVKNSSFLFYICLTCTDYFGLFNINAWHQPIEFSPCKIAYFWSVPQPPIRTFGSESFIDHDNSVWFFQDSFYPVTFPSAEQIEGIINLHGELVLNDCTQVKNYLLSLWRIWWQISSHPEIKRLRRIYLKTWNNIEKIIIPYDNESDLDEIPKEIKEKIKFVTVKNYEEVSKEVWK